MAEQVVIEIPCSGCVRVMVRLPSDGSAFYWTQQFGYQMRALYCAQCAVQYEAPLIKPQPKSQKVDGWDI